MWLYVPPTWSDPDYEYRDRINILDGCSGSGMFAVAVAEACRVRGIDARALVHIEREATTAAAGVGLEKAAGGEAAVWDDLASFDGGPWRGIIDIACVGLPCQPYSSAGKARGNADDRAWGSRFDPGRIDTWGPQPHFLRILGECRPWMVLFEESPRWLAGGWFALFGACLHRLGYTVEEPIILAAGDVGAPHGRERAWIMAHTRLHESYERCTSQDGPGLRNRDDATSDESPSRCGELADSGGARREGAERAGPCVNAGSAARRPTTEQRADVGDAERPFSRPGLGGLEGQPTEHQRIDRSADASAELGDPDGDGGRQDPRHSEAERPHADEPGEGLGDARSSGRDAEPGRPDEQLAAGCPDVRLHPPGRTDWAAWAAVAHLDPARMPAIESGVPVVADGLALSNADLLRIGGNGVDTLAATIAVGRLLDRAGIGEVTA